MESEESESESESESLAELESDVVASEETELIDGSKVDELDCVS